ncbi:MULTISPECIES: DsbC family protein [Acinetobacter]|jgi:thiol:disulfide interchange protein DsbC|uniref:Thiol:disulfide interchange protein n=2 Tax=Bacteria TaxID=2 RepID=N9AHW0_9GAMM|nr:MULTISPECIES: DsbC family protein [Acinetobacter]MDN5555330.1 DsbC family protein [Acinetobacter sp.]ENV43280.1 hypothetical protein F955_02827 [Acinetobacter schindleri CIP 107287]MDG9798687.1 DsbC family protein [Acinetobacter johnsonii]MDV2441451.1 DsbC family protein [Acinetobacter gerneri]HRA29602.1 DsbC family protein [Acinetobacter johnsonii]
MKKTILLLSLALATSFSVSASVEKTTANLKKAYPATTFNKVEKTPISGIYEVVMGQNVAYTDVNGRYFIFGNLYDMHTQKDITATPDSSQKVYFPNAEQLKNAIKEVKGNGQRKIVVFSDPDCPYCARLEQTLIGLDNVTIYTFLYPLEQLHPTAKSTAINIWCSKDPAKAMKDYMLAKIKPEIKTCKNPIDSNIAFGSGFGVQGTPSIIFEDGTLIPGAMSLEAIEQQLQKSHDKVVNNAK